MSVWFSSPSSGAAATPGSDTQVIFNDSGASAGDADLTWNKTTNALTSAGSIFSPLHTGGTTAAANLTLRSTTNGSKGQVYLDETTASTSSTTGALRVDGGACIGGELYMGGRFRAINGSNASPAVSFATATNHGLTCVSSSRTDYVAAGATLLAFTSATCQVYGSLQVRPDGATGNFQVGNNATAITRIRHGNATLVAGTVTVTDANVTANTRFFVSIKTDGGTPGAVRVSAVSVGTSFTITSSSGSDTSTVSWMTIEP